MLNYPCAICHNYECTQEHKWYYMDNSLLVQTVLQGLEEMLRRAGHTQAPYPYLHSTDMMAAEAEYIYPTTSHTTMYPPAFDAEGPFVPNDMDALVGRMQNACITPQAHLIDDWVAEGSASHGPSLSYDTSAPWPAEGYASAPQDADPDEDIHYTRQYANLVETSFHSLAPAPLPVPSISVIEHFEQGTYPPKQVVKGKPVGPIYFNGELGVSLGSLDALVDGEEPAFDAAASIGTRASIRFELPQFPEHSMQVRVRHGNGKGQEGRPITLREMGDTVFGVLKKLMDHVERRGDSLRHGGSVVDIERVVLLRINHISKGSIQPILGIRNNG